jgi:hypothetical protein
MRSLKLISHFTINQLHYEVHRCFVRVYFRVLHYVWKALGLKVRKKILTKREGQIVVGLKFWTLNAPRPFNSSTPYLLNFLTVHCCFRQSIIDVTNVKPLDSSMMFLVVRCWCHQHRTFWESISNLSQMSPTSEPSKLCCWNRSMQCPLLIFFSHLLFDWHLIS